MAAQCQWEVASEKEKNIEQNEKESCSCYSSYGNKSAVFAWACSKVNEA